jgi:predicted nucleotidyltransferase component of viral defense system
MALSSLQTDFLHAWFKLSHDYYLTGGGALIGFYGWERTTEDLDLFSADTAALDHVDKILSEACVELGAEFQAVRTYREFRRYTVTRGGESIQLDFVIESVPQICKVKAVIDAVTVDALEEIFANKLTTVVSRSEVRDLWDVYQFVQRGLSITDALYNANLKDAGVSAEAVVFVLGDVNWEELRKAAQRAGLANWDEVEQFFRKWLEQLRMSLLPPSSA